MESSLFYKKILSVWVPIFMFLWGAWFIVFQIIPEKNGQLFILQFVSIYLSIVVIVECVIAFFRTSRILSSNKRDILSIVKIKLLYLPYLPGIFGALVCCAITLVMKGVLYYRVFIVSLGSCLFLNFSFAMYFNFKTSIPEKIGSKE